MDLSIHELLKEIDCLQLREHEGQHQVLLHDSKYIRKQVASPDCRSGGCHVASLEVMWMAIPGSSVIQPVADLGFLASWSSDLLIMVGR